MTSVPLPDPVVRRTGAPPVGVGALQRALEQRVDGEVRFDAGSRGAYSTDASNYRQVPIGVVVPRTVEGGVEAVAVCREHGAPVVSRGGGTSLAGQSCNVTLSGSVTRRSRAGSPATTWTRYWPSAAST